MYAPPSPNNQRCGLMLSPFLPSPAFSVTRFRGDAEKAASVYKGIQPLVAEDIAEDIVWAASRKDNVYVPLISLLFSWCA